METIMTRRQLLAAIAAAAAQTAQGQTPEATASNEDFWFQTRMAFTVDRNLLNFNNGSLCPAPKIVQEAMERYWTVTNLSPSYYVDELLIPETEVVRTELAREFGCDPEELALTRNTSEGLHNVIYGLDLRRGDEESSPTTQDYSTMITSFDQRARRDGIVLRRFPFPTPPAKAMDLADLFWKNVTPKTKAILVSHMTFSTGQIFPIGEICREARRRGIYSIVDGAHGFAHLVFRRDDLDCDFYSTSLHKWLTAPVGTGFLYVRRRIDSTRLAADGGAGVVGFQTSTAGFPKASARSRCCAQLGLGARCPRLPSRPRRATAEAQAGTRLRFLRRRWERSAVPQRRPAGDPEEMRTKSRNLAASAASASKACPPRRSPKPCKRATAFTCAPASFRVSSIASVLTLRISTRRPRKWTGSVTRSSALPRARQTMSMPCREGPTCRAPTRFQPNCLETLER